MAFREDLPRDIRSRDKRRGPRMNCRVAVAVEWKKQAGSPSRSENTFTRVVNTYGCLLVSSQEIGLREKVRLTNLATKCASDGVVVWTGTQRPDGWDIGVELVGADMDFWGIDL